MLGDAIRKLKLDRRLWNRKGWLQEGELDTALGELPDLSENATTAEEAEAGGEAPSGA